MQADLDWGLPQFFEIDLENTRMSASFGISFSLVRALLSYHLLEDAVHGFSTEWDTHAS